MLIIHSIVYKFEIEYSWTSLIHNVFHLEIRSSVMRDQTSARTEIDHLAKSVRLMKTREPLITHILFDLFGVRAKELNLLFFLELIINIRTSLIT